jgi:hypothetical protein
VNSRGNLVDILAARPLGANSTDINFAERNRYVIGDWQHAAIPPDAPAFESLWS